MAARGSQTIVVGEVRVQERLGSTCVYRVIGVQPDHVTLEVLQAPGLARGHALRVTRRSAAAMRRLDPSAWPHAAADAA